MPFEVNIYAALVIAYYVCNLILALSFLGWFFIRLDSIIARNGSIDLFHNVIFRLFPWQLLLYAAFRFLYFVL